MQLFSIFQYLFYNMYNNGIIITRMSRMIIKVNKRIVLVVVIQ